MKWTHIENERTICLGHIMDIENRQIINGELHIENGYIVDIVKKDNVPHDAPYYLPGFIDSHVHIESSMMVPVEFSHIARSHGTTGVMADPHEIANVLGIEGINFMINSGQRTHFHFAFAAPSCVPSCSTDFETAGAMLDSTAIRQLMERDDITHLGEMMNYPGVVGGDKEVLAKVQAALDNKKPVDGHAPGVTGEERMRYAKAGITTDHECSTAQEAIDCIKAGMKVLIREGSAAKNYQALAPLITEYHDQLMFCTDDCHPADFIRGHIDRIVRRAMTDGYNIWDILQIACVNPVKHYHMDWGLLHVGDKADFISLTDLTAHFRVRKVYIDGQKVYSFNNYSLALDEQMTSIQSQRAMLYEYPNHFLAEPITIEDLRRDVKPGDTIRVIGASDGSLLTEDRHIHVTGNPFVDNSHNWNEIQKIVVLNRHQAGAKPQVAFISGFGLTNGALACSIAHDCHNIVAIGNSDEQICRAINRIVEMKGGIVAIAGNKIEDLQLPIAGLISPLNGHEIAYRCQLIDETAHEAGCPFASPFITMAFMCLPVIPSLKLTDKGLFDSQHFQFV